MTVNYLRLQPVYTLKFEQFANPAEDGISFNPQTGFAAGEAKIDPFLHFQLNDMQQSIIATAYSGISHCLYIIDSTIELLEKDYSLKLKFKHPVSDEEIKEIRDGLDVGEE